MEHAGSMELNEKTKIFKLWPQVKKNPKSVA